MDLDVSDSPPKPEWPNGNVYLTPAYLNTLQQRLRLLKSRFRHFIETQDPEVGFDLDWLLVEVSEDAFTTIRFIAEEVPPTVPVDPCLAAATSALASELEAVIGDGNTPDFLSQIEALPNPDWDDVFKGYCRVLEASVDAYLIGDSPVYQVKLADASAPDLIFRVLRGLIMALERYPFLRSFHKRLMRKLERSRSGAVYTEWWMREIPKDSDPTPKRKIDTLGLDRPAKKRLLLSSPPEY
ncbi:hypothetical protein F5B21DRAFT_516800 [Xylaria acuta]|nr:hypothetical protein F5B21DRAFT_516800 [Xylaria acuta]